MQAAALKNVFRPSTLDWESLLPQCALPHCQHRRGRLQGLLHRGEGVRCGDDWYCSPDCLHEYLVGRIVSLQRRSSDNQVLNHRLPLGLVLLSRGHVEHDTLQLALALQRSTGVRIGECLRKLSAVSEHQITNALAAQWSCPVYPPDRGSECRALIPHHLQEFHRMLPVHFVESTRDLYIAFEQFVDYTVLLAVESMLGCRTRPCVLAETELRRRLREGPFATDHAEIVLASTAIAPLEFARAIVSYIQETGADQIRLLACGAHLWARLYGPRPLDLLVRRSNV